MSEPTAMGLLASTSRLPSWIHYPVMVVDLEFEIRQPFRLPTFAGSMFRGCLGWALKEVCHQDVYQYLFETCSGRPGQADASRPFLLIPPLAGRQLEEGDFFILSLRLFGQGCDHLQNFLEAFEVAGNRGLGRRKCKFELVRAIFHEGEYPWVMYERDLGWARAYFPLPTALGNFCTGVDHEVVAVELAYVTPTRLIYRGERVFEPEFHVVLRALYRRLESLLVLHGSCQNLPDLKETLDDALAVQSSHNVKWADWERRSNRQKRKHLMGGFVGTSVYHGQLHQEWLELLAAGEVLHLGKATTFGMGGYKATFHVG